MAAVFGVASVGLRFGSSRLSGAAYDLTRSIQGIYGESIRTGKVHRLSFLNDKQTFELAIFEVPQPRPPQSDLEATEKWEQERAAKEEELSHIPLEERGRLDWGRFKKIKEGHISSSIHIKALFIGQKEATDENADKSGRHSLLFYPSGEVDQALIVLKEGELDGDGRSLSLIVEPMSGRVRTQPGEIAKDDWIRHFGAKQP